MKKKAITALILTLIMTLVLPAYNILVGTNHFDVVFEDASTPSLLRDFIVADVQRCYETWGTNVTFEPNLPVRHGSYIEPVPRWHDFRRTTLPPGIRGGARRHGAEWWLILIAHPAKPVVCGQAQAPAPASAGLDGANARAFLRRPGLRALPVVARRPWRRASRGCGRGRTTRSARCGS